MEVVFQNGPHERGTSLKETLARVWYASWH